MMSHYTAQSSVRLTSFPCLSLQFCILLGEPFYLFIYKFFTLLYIFAVYVSMYMFRHTAHACAEERPIYGSQFFSSILWEPGIKLRLGARHHYLLTYLVDCWLFILRHKIVKLLTSKRSPKQPVLKQLLTTCP